jgi:hypothetical protein
MVRFSDMLGGDGEPDETRGTTAAPDLPAVDDESPEPDEPAAEANGTVGEPPASQQPEQSPQEVLDRLTQYASASRAAEQARHDAAATPTEEPAPETSEAEPEREPPGDDLLPRAKRSLRNPRGKRP